MNSKMKIFEKKFETDNFCENLRNSIFLVFREKIGN